MEEPKATEKPIETQVETAPTIASEEDAEAKYARLEAEKENYRKAYLKEAAKNKVVVADETDEDEITRKVNEAIANSKLADIAREQDELIKKALKENKELKLAQLNKTAPSAVVGTHNESTPVADTLVTPDQMAWFKSQGWSDAKITAYKENLLKKR